MLNALSFRRDGMSSVAGDRFELSVLCIKG